MPINGPQNKLKLSQRKKRVGRRILENCCKVLEVQLLDLQAQGGITDDSESSVGAEQPFRASSWKEPALRKLTRACGGSFRVDGCRHGLPHPVTQKPMPKSFGWLSTSPRVRSALQHSCQHKIGDHHPIEGSITSSTAVYPKLVCERFAKALMHVKDHFCEASLFVEQLQESSQVYSDGRGEHVEHPEWNRDVGDESNEELEAVPEGEETHTSLRKP